MMQCGYGIIGYAGRKRMQREAAVALMTMVLSVLCALTAHAGTPRATLEDLCSRTEDYGCYVNHRYGYALAWPKRLLTPMGESDAGDGQVFTAPDGRAELRCWGGFSDTPQQALPEALKAALSEPGRRVTYRHVAKDFFVLSGFTGGRIFYRKTVQAHDVLATFELIYDTALKKEFDRTVRDMSSSFTVGPDW